MDQLLSGLFGAIIATILTVVYLYFAEKYKIRSEVLLEVVGFCNDIYRHLLNLHSFKGAKYTNTKTFLSEEDYRKISQELTVLLISTTVHVKMAITYGEREELALFLELSTQFRRVAKILHRATKSGWENEGSQIHQLLEKKIDPMRNDLQRVLIKGTTPSGILLSMFKYHMPTIYRIAARIKKYETRR